MEDRAGLIKVLEKPRRWDRHPTLESLRMAQAVLLS